VAIVARWKPVHRGHAAVLRGLMEQAEEVWIGIGSSNRYDSSNPFTAVESAEMLRLVLPDPRGRIFEVVDLGDGPRWSAALRERLGDLDAFVTANPYVARLMAPYYTVVHPVWFVPEQVRVPIDGTMVRRAMLAGEAWERMVPPEVADYLASRGLVTRFVREFADVA
jgi:nicotinamide-nucleotide adenylyltransferase